VRRNRSNHQTRGFSLLSQYTYRSILIALLLCMIVSCDLMCVGEENEDTSFDCRAALFVLFEAEKRWCVCYSLWRKRLRVCRLLRCTLHPSCLTPIFVRATWRAWPCRRSERGNGHLRLKISKTAPYRARIRASRTLHLHYTRCNDSRDINALCACVCNGMCRVA